MALKRYFMIRTVVLMLILVISIALFTYMAYVSNVRKPEGTGPVAQEQLHATGTPSFAWRFEEGVSLNPDGMPETEIHLGATYPDGTIRTRLIGTSHASCNALPDAEEDSVPRTAVIQCYGAGLGYRFRITEGQGAYLIQRKTFEEASPEYDPSAYEYETVAEFPFSA